MFTERYRRISDLPEEIPVFPLRGVILLPRTVLPLNVFEPRYLALIDDILGGQRLLGLVQPKTRSGADTAAAIGADGEESESPLDPTWPLRRTACIGRVTAFSEQIDGRLFINITGITRVRLGDEQPFEKPYRRFKVDAAPFAGDLERDRGADEVDREKLLSLLRAYLDANSMNADWKSISQSSTEYLVNMLSIHSPYGPEEKQALLEADDLKARADILMALAEMDLASRNDGGAGGTVQ